MIPIGIRSAYDLFIQALMRSIPIISAISIAFVLDLSLIRSNQYTVVEAWPYQSGRAQLESHRVQES